MATEAKTIECNGNTYEVDPSIYHFTELLKAREEDISNLSGIINEFQSFLDYWDDFKRSKQDPTYANKHLNRFNLFHTIKPKTKYAHQQEFRNKKPVLYPIYRIENGTVHSMAPGGNYPLKDCIIHYGDGTHIAVLK